MKAILIPTLALLAFSAAAQTNTNEITRADRARALLRGTNQFRAPTFPTLPPPTVEVSPDATNRIAPRVTAAQATNATAPAATGVVAVPVLPAIPVPAVESATTTTTVTTNVTTGPTVTVPVPTAQVPNRAIAFPQLPAATPTVTAATPVVGAPPPTIQTTNSLGEVRDVEEGTVDFKGAPLEQIFEVYQDMSKRTVLRPYQLPAQAITLHLATPMSKREVVQAIDSVLALNGIVMIPLGELFVKAVPAAQAQIEGADIDKSKTSDLPAAEQFITKVITLKTAKPSEVAQLIQSFAKTPTAVTPIDSNNTIVLRDYTSNIKRMLELIEKIDVVPEKDFKLEVIPIRYGKVTDIYATMSALISGGGGGAGPTGSGFSGRGTGGGGIGGMGGRGGLGNRSGLGNQGLNSMNRGYGGSQYGSPYGGGAVYPQQVAQPNVAGAQNNFQGRLNQILSRASQPEAEKILENANIVPDERSNKLLIFANKRDMEMITNIVNKVDVLLAQVLIEAVILEVNLGDTLNVGVSAAQRGKQFTPNFFGAGAMNNGQALFSGLTNFPSSSPSGFTYAGTFGNSFDVAIQAISTDRKAHVISRPRIQTSHAIPGNIFVGETRPYVTGYTGYSLGTSLATQSQVQEKTIGFTLAVTPFITPEGLVVMDLQQQFDTFKGNIDVAGNPYPLVDSREADSTLTVRNGDLIMMGGFITDSASKSKSGVPLLKDIPGLGALFRSSVSENSRTELIILMRATVLETPEQAAFLATQERATLPGVREAELNQREADAKRSKHINKLEKKGY
jgi:general secretion pathway protein D